METGGVPGTPSASPSEQARELRARSKVLCARVLENLDRSRLLIERVQSTRQAAGDTLRLAAELQRTVRDYAAILRQLGEAPETAIVKVKEIAWEAAQMIDDPLHIPPLDRQGLANDLVRWTVAGYFPR